MNDLETLEKAKESLGKAFANKLDEEAYEITKLSYKEFVNQLLNLDRSVN
jgi:hypothetical protein